MEYKSWQGDIKALAGDNGGFEGYASLFDVVDQGGDVVERGAFADAIPNFVRDGFIGDGHNWGSVGEGALGTIKDAHEDERGLYIKAEYHSTPAAQVARAISQERMARGKSVGLSIGFAIAPGGADEDRATGVRHLTKINPLFEVSQVNVPMLRPAGLTAVKGMRLADHDDLLTDAEAAYVERWRALVAAELKEGRVLSEARRARIAGHRDQLRLNAIPQLVSVVDDLDALLKETEPPLKDPQPTEADASPLAALFAQLAQFDAVYGREIGITR